MNRLIDIVIHALAVFGLIALVAHFSPKLKYSDEALIDDTGVTIEKQVTHRI